MCQDGNRGDLAILAGTVAAVRRAAPSAEVSIAPMELASPSRLATEQADSALLADRSLIGSPVPARRAEGLGAAAWTARLSRAFLSEHLRLERLGGAADKAYASAAREADLVIAKGGSWLFSYREPAQIIFTLRMLHQLRVAQRVGTPTAVLGTSLGPWQQYNRGQYQRVLGRCEAVVVRERLSLAFAEANGLDNAVAGVDMAYALFEPRSQPAVKSGVAITPRVPPYVEAAAVARYEEALVVAARRIVDEFHEPVYLATQVHLDLELCRRLERAIDRPGKVHVADHINGLPLDELMAWYGARRLLLGTRVHSIILAAMAGTASVVLECDPPKMVGISEDLGLDDWRLPTDGPEILTLRDFLDEALGGADEKVVAMQERLVELAARARSQTASLLAPFV